MGADRAGFVTVLTFSYIAFWQRFAPRNHCTTLSATVDCWQISDETPLSPASHVLRVAGLVKYSHRCCGPAGTVTVKTHNSAETTATSASG